MHSKETYYNLDGCSNQINAANQEIQFNVGESMNYLPIESSCIDVDLTVSKDNGTDLIKAE